MRQKHSDLDEDNNNILPAAEPRITSDCPEDLSDDDEERFCSFPGTVNSSCNPVEAVGAQFVSRLRSNSSVTVSTCETAISGCHDVIDVVIDKLKQTLVSSTKDKLSHDDLHGLLNAFDIGNVAT